MMKEKRGNYLSISAMLLLLIMWSCNAAKKVKLPLGSTGVTASSSVPGFFTVADFESVDKFDTHIHLNTDETAYIEQAKVDNLRFLDIVDDRPFGLPMTEQEKIALQQIQAFPDRLVYATTFSISGYNNDDWVEKSISKIKEAVSNGAVAVKIWKNVGMDLKDSKGNFVMIDNPRLDPILDYMAKNGIPLIAHLGEPKECWMPLNQMVLNKGYYSQHPEYHMYLHPEYPSYEAHMKARDNMLEKHPDLTFINAHLASLEWSLEEIAKRLDRFPNMAVDLARISNLYLHAKNDWQKTRDFFIKYQDRLLYATDVQVGKTNDPASLRKSAHDSRIRYWTFFTTDETLKERNIGDFKGLKLPANVINKIYRQNAAKWLARIKIIPGIK